MDAHSHPCHNYGFKMDVWIGVLAFVLFLGFATATVVCIGAIKKKTDIVIESRLHHGVARAEVIYANLGLIAVVVLTIFKIYIFVPAALTFALFIVLSTRIKSGLTAEGAVVGTTFIDWEFMKGYKLVDEEEDSNVIILKIRANRKQYVLVCDRKDKDRIKKTFTDHRVKETEVIRDETSD